MIQLLIAMPGAAFLYSPAVGNLSGGIFTGAVACPGEKGVAGKKLSRRKCNRKKAVTNGKYRKKLTSLCNPRQRELLLRITRWPGIRPGSQ